MTLRVLIVEDEALVAAELEWLVIDAGHEAVGTAVAGDDACDLAEALRPDLALVDVNLVDGPTGVPAARRMAASLRSLAWAKAVVSPETPRSPKPAWVLKSAVFNRPSSKPNASEAVY